MYNMDLDFGFCAWVYCKDWAPQHTCIIKVLWDSGIGICLPNSPDGPPPPGLDAAGSANPLNSSFLFCVLIQSVEELQENFLMGVFNTTFITSWENTLIISPLVNGRKRDNTLCGWRQYAAVSFIIYSSFANFYICSWLVTLPITSWSCHIP